MHYFTYTCWCNNCNRQVLAPSCPMFNGGGIKSLLEKLLNIPQKHTITGIMWASIIPLKPHIALLLQEYDNRTGWTMFLMFPPQTLKESKNYNLWYPTPWCQDLELYVDTSYSPCLNCTHNHHLQDGRIYFVTVNILMPDNTVVEVCLEATCLSPVAHKWFPTVHYQHIWGHIYSNLCCVHRVAYHCCSYSA